MAAGYNDAARSEPFLPFAGSVLPALVALRKTHGVVAASRAYLTDEPWSPAPGPETALGRAQKQLALGRERLADQKALRAALEARAANLRAGLEVRSAMTAAQRRQEKLEALRAKKSEYDRDTSVLLRALRQFIHTQLGPMLAAEELGGPVVGGMADVQADDLEGGFNAQGRPRRVGSKGNGKDKENERDGDGRRQRRLDELWGGRGGGGGGSDGDDGQNSDDANDNNDTTMAEGGAAATAAAELQELTEELLNAVASAGGGGAAAYVAVARESAAARFLVRSKVAQFHPKDAARLRLIDFGRELDD